MSEHQAPAFPGYTMHEGDDGTINVTKLNPGMTLRDYFAAKAIHPVIASAYESKTWQIVNWQQVAKASYDIADAMIAARSKGESPK